MSEKTTPEPNEGKGTGAAKAPASETTRLPDFFEPWNWVNEWFEDWPRMFGRRLPMPWWPQTGPEAIRTEQYLEGDQLVIRAELPGVDPDEGIEVSVHNDRLTIAAHREHRQESRTEGAFQSEFRYGALRRVVPLPAGTAPDDVKASYDNGILEVRVPVEKARQASTKIRVERKD